MAAVRGEQAGAGQGCEEFGALDGGADQAVELAEERLRRGGRERRYSAVRGRPLSEQREGAALLVETLVNTLRERIARRDPEGEGVTVDAELWVDPEVWEEARHRLVAVTDDLHAAAHPVRTPGTAPVGVSVMAFPMRKRTPGRNEDC